MVLIAYALYAWNDFHRLGLPHSHAGQVEAPEVVTLAELRRALDRYQCIVR